MNCWNGCQMRVAALVVALPLSLQTSEPAPIRGAWRIVRTSLTTGAPSFRDYTQPGLLLFTARHYSLMYVEGNEPRRMFQNPASPTGAEKLEAYDTFVGHSGTYSLEDSIVAMTVDVAKFPNLMGPELRSTFARFVYRIRGDTLLLTRRGPRGTFIMQLIKVG